MSRHETHKALQRAYDRGYMDYTRRGKTAAQNPYPDYRTHRGAVTWSRSFRTAWADGRRSAEAFMNMHPTPG